MQSNNINLDHLLSADLHTHSFYSDGVLSPEDLAHRAKDNGVELWALTDHDELAGVKEAAAAAKKLDLPFLTGVEISTCFAKESIHVVGLGVDVDNETLLQGLQKIRQGRRHRGEAIAQALKKVGVSNALEGAQCFAKNPDLISRSHFSRFLVSQGVCKDTFDAFNRYLGKGKPAYVTHEWISLEECLGWIHGAKGVAVLAHPARYRELSKNQRRLLLAQFCALGGRGVEVISGGHSKEDGLLYAKIALEYGLLASRASDFHSPLESRIDIGKLPLLGAELTPIWSVLQDRIIYAEK